ncbi:MGH1-like glycoside hydrolase domain-containing protein [Paramuribaculum intestinale]|uniref:MGH1-like glycoside hydrolase domain-containing protein n=2 Tax=Paramuribaculum intestinale TaxID=2094151 RepID=UPI0025B366B6|nr:trehalase family glycosidase [Paramuribaculum intestinale]
MIRSSILRFVAMTFFGVFASVASAQWNTVPPDAVVPDWRSEVPIAVHPDTSLVNLYERAWEIASGRVRRGPEGMVASPYLDENCYDDQIWIWDGCFMVMFSKYAPNAFPGKETLMNYYAPIHDGAPSPLRIHLRDNPPLFAWVEKENYLFTGDTAQIDMVVRDKRYLQKHYDYFNSLQCGERNDELSTQPIRITVRRDSLGEIIGYSWHGGASGMDNTPRGRDCGGYQGALWIDAISQQALAATNIAELCRLRGDTAQASAWQKEFERLRKVVNDRYWDERDGYYYDVNLATGEPSRVMTPASFWAMLAGIPDSTQASRMVERLRSEAFMGGERPWNSLSRSDQDFDSVTGNYWRGGIWLPIVYMGSKALERYGYCELADSLAEKVVRMQARIYEQTEPHTIWECYSPVADEPSTEHGHRVRQEFCGWSALGPISLFIENIMGFRKADALSRTLTWDIKASNGTHGLRRLRFGDVETSLVYDAPTNSIAVSANRPYTLVARGRSIPVAAGESTISL